MAEILIINTHVLECQSLIAVLLMLLGPVIHGLRYRNVTQSEL